MIPGQWSVRELVVGNLGHRPLRTSKLRWDRWPGGFIQSNTCIVGSVLERKNTSRHSGMNANKEIPQRGTAWGSYRICLMDVWVKQ